MVNKQNKILLYKKNLLGSEQEGYVVRVKSAFKYDEFKSSVAKYVKSNFEQKRIDYTTESYSVNKQI